MPQKTAYRRPKKRADTMIERARELLEGRTALYVFIRALKNETRDAVRRAYHRYLERGTLVEKVRQFVYLLLHGKEPSPA